MNPSSSPDSNPPTWPPGFKLEIGEDEFQQDGLYVILPGGRKIALTREKVAAFAHLFESNLDRIPTEIRAAAAFQACPVCPEKDTSKFCHALPATLAFFDELKGAKSFDVVAAIFKSPQQRFVFVPQISIQEGIQYVAILSLLYYCELGRQYRKFLLGIDPLMSPEEMVTRIHLNVFWDCKGDHRKVDDVLGLFSNQITCTCRCQVNRLRLICQDETLVNAFVNTQVQIEWLATSKGALVDREFEKFTAEG